MMLNKGAMPANAEEKDFGVKIPDDVWEYVCENDLGDGTYEFDEGGVIIRNGIIDWKKRDEIIDTADWKACNE